MERPQGGSETFAGLSHGDVQQRLKGQQTKTGTAGGRQVANEAKATGRQAWTGGWKARGKGKTGT